MEKAMRVEKSFWSRFIRLIFGLFLFAVGIVLNIHANIGYAPWDIFHAGISSVSGISIGQASMLAGFVAGLISVLLGEEIGIGSIANMFLIGIFVDFIISTGIVPVLEQPALGTIMMLTGFVIIAFASYFYMSSGFGAGPRDALMVAVSRKTDFNIGIVRTAIEILVGASGYLMGGLVGFGTVLCALSIGWIVDKVFRILDFNPKLIDHENLSETFARIKQQRS